MGKLKKLREAIGMSQSEFAKKAGINVRTYQMYEQGAKLIENAKMETIIKICLALSCEISDIIEDQKILSLLHEYKKEEE